MEAIGVMAVKKGQVSLVSQRVGPPSSNQVLLKTLYSAISPGTELAVLHCLPNTGGVFPFPLGYSSCCEVVEKGESVSSLDIGNRVAVAGRHASHIIADADACVVLPDSIESEQAAAFRLVSIALQAVRRGRIQLGWDVAILGLGPIGNLAAQLASVSGATHVAGIDPQESRRNLALSCGLNSTYENVKAALAAGVDFHVVIESSGVPEAIVDAFHLAKRMGTVILLGSTRGETKSVNFYRDVHKKCLTILGTHESIRPKEDYLVYCSHLTDNRTSVKLIEARKVRVLPIISGIVDYQEAPSAYERLWSNREGLMTIVLKWE